METREAAERWAETWARAWSRKDAQAIAVLYAPQAGYRSHPLRDPHPGGAVGYVRSVFAEEEAIECSFARPLVDGERAAVEWWAVLQEDGEETTLVGTTLLRFAADGLVVDHRDYWVQAPGRRGPYAGWRQD